MGDPKANKFFSGSGAKSPHVPWQNDAGSQHHFTNIRIQVTNKWSSPAQKTCFFIRKTSDLTGKKYEIEQHFGIQTRTCVHINVIDSEGRKLWSHLRIVHLLFGFVCYPMLIYERMEFIL